MQKNEFLRQFPDRFIKELDDGNLSVTLPGSGLSVIVSAKNRFQSADRNGNNIPKHSNIRLGLPGDELTVVTEDPETGNFKRGTRTASQISDAWEQDQREYAERRGPKMIRDSGIEMQDGTGRTLVQVSVADPEADPQTVSRMNRMLEGKAHIITYGSFLVSPDAIIPSVINPKEVDIYLGHEDDTVSGYLVFISEFGESGKGRYEKATRTAGKVRDNYEAYVEEQKQIKARRQVRLAAEKQGSEPDNHKEEDIGPEL